MRIRKSAEDYLEAILVIEQEKGRVRSIDIANKLGFSKPSVSIAMKQFRENGYIEVDDTGAILLTESGKKIAENTLERHRLLTDFLVYIGVTPETAKHDACEIEHDISTETFEKLREYAQIVALRRNDDID